MMSGKYLTAKSDKVIDIFLPCTLSLALSRLSYSSRDDCRSSALGCCGCACRQLVTDSWTLAPAPAGHQHACSSCSLRFVCTRSQNNETALGFLQVHCRFILGFMFQWCSCRLSFTAVLCLYKCSAVTQKAEHGCKLKMGGKGACLLILVLSFHFHMASLFPC